MALTPMHRRLLVVVAALVAVTVAGLVALWPRADELPVQEPPPADLVTAVIVELRFIEGEPDPVLLTSGDLVDVTVELLDGDEPGRVLTITEVPTDGYPDFRVGDRIELERAEVPGSDTEFFIRDFQRLPTLALLVGAFVAAVLLIGRWHGVRSLLGLGASLLVVIEFIVPAILSGASPPLVALVGALAVMIITLYVTHGVNEMTTSAVVGTAGALGLTVALGLAFIDRSKITGFASDDAMFARFAVEGLDLQGLVLAGLIIAALGVLDDVTVSQASTVFAIHDTDRTLSWRGVFARAMKVGRDHISSVVNTLFLAYAGASLALLVLFSTSPLAIGELLNSEVVAEELVKIVVGSLGLIAAVPLTTALAASVAVSRPADHPPMHGGHTHGHGGDGGASPTGRTRGLRQRSRDRVTGSPDTAGSPSDTDDASLTDEERAYRSWVNYLQQEGDQAADDPDGTRA